MAEISQEQFDALQKANEALAAENAELKDQFEKSQAKIRETVEGFNQQLREIRNSVEHGGAVVIRPKEPIDGVFTAKYKDPETGKQITRKVKFQDGQRKVRLADGAEVSSAALMRIAEGGEATKEELHVFPALSTVNKEKAAARLTDLVKLNYPLLQDAD